MGESKTVMHIGSHEYVDSIDLNQRFILTASEDHSIFLWDREKRSKQDLGHNAFCVSIHPSENKFASGDKEQLKMNTLYTDMYIERIDTLEVLGFIFADEKSVSTVKVSDKIIVSGGMSGKVRVWSYYELFEWEQSGIVTSVDIHKDLVASCSTGGIQLWQLDLDALDDEDSIEGRKVWEETKPANCVSFSEDGRLLVVGCEDHFFLLEIESQRVLLRQECDEVHSIGFLDNEFFFVGSNRLRLWNIYGCYVTLDKDAIRVASNFGDEVVFADLFFDVYLWDAKSAREWLQEWYQIYSEIKSFNKLSLEIQQPVNRFQQEGLLALKSKANLLDLEVSERFEVWIQLLSPVNNDMSLGQNLRF